MKALHLLHKSGNSVMFAVESAEVRSNPLMADGFNLTYVSENATVMFLRTENFDAVVLLDRVDEP